MFSFGSGEKLPDRHCWGLKKAYETPSQVLLVARKNINSKSCSISKNIVFCFYGYWTGQLNIFEKDKWTIKWFSLKGCTLSVWINMLNRNSEVFLKRFIVFTSSWWMMQPTKVLSFKFVFSVLTDLVIYYF